MIKGFKDYIDTSGKTSQSKPAGRTAEMVAWLVEHEHLINSLPGVEISFHAYGKGISAKFAVLFRQQEP